jgi:hypothetical protein
MQTLGAAWPTRRAIAGRDAEATGAARRLCIGGSLIGSIKETQEMLDFCGKHNLTCDVEVRRAPAPARRDAALRAAACCVSSRELTPPVLRAVCLPCMLRWELHRRPA